MGPGICAFPAYAGMNRLHRLLHSLPWGVPRVCGDEPLKHSMFRTLFMRSPRMRG